MRNLPYSSNGKTLDWLEIHAKQWVEEGASVGITPAQAAEMAALVEEARAAYAAASAARQAAQSATLLQNTTLDAARKKAAALVAVAKASIAVQEDPALYATAGLEPSAVGGRTGPALETPSQPRAIVTSHGVVQLRWVARQRARNVMYQVHRAVDGGEFAMIATVGAKKFADAHAPAGARTLTYFVRAQKGSRVGGTSSSTTVTPVGVSNGMRQSAAA